MLIVSDASDPEAQEHLKVTEDVIAELGASDKPRLYVFNKVDSFETIPTAISERDTVFVSAKTGYGIETLLELIEAKLSESKKTCNILIPYDKQALVNAIYGEYSVKSTDYTAQGTLIVADLDEKGRSIYAAYISED